MLRAFASSLVCLLLLTTFVWGGCVSCEQFFMFSSAKRCCAPDGHCKTKVPGQNKRPVECKQVAFQHQNSADGHVQLPFLSTLSFEPLVLETGRGEHWNRVQQIEPSPPDLRILHATFLI